MYNALLDEQSWIDEFHSNPFRVQNRISRLLGDEVESNTKESDLQLMLCRRLFDWSESYKLVCFADASFEDRIEGSMIFDSKDELRSYLQEEDEDDEEDELSSDWFEFDPQHYQVNYQNLEISHSEVQIQGLRLRTENLNTKPLPVVSYL